MAQGKYAEAAEEFREVLREFPRDDAAEHNLRVAAARAQSIVPERQHDSDVPPLLAAQGAAFDKKCEMIVLAVQEFRRHKGIWPGSQSELATFCVHNGRLPMEEAVQDIADLSVVEEPDKAITVGFRAGRPWDQTGRKEQVTVTVKNGARIEAAAP
jgi:hypothetical protein